MKGNNAKEIQQETATAIAHLVNATMADREHMTSLAATITTLTVQLANTDQKLVKVISKSGAPQVKVTTLNRKTDRRGGTSRIHRSQHDGGGDAQ